MGYRKFCSIMVAIMVFSLTPISACELSMLYPSGKAFDKANINVPCISKNNLIQSLPNYKKNESHLLGHNKTKKNKSHLLGHNKTKKKPHSIAKSGISNTNQSKLIEIKNNIVNAVSENKSTGSTLNQTAGLNVTDSTNNTNTEINNTDENKTSNTINYDDSNNYRDAIDLKNELKDEYNINVNVLALTGNDKGNISQGDIIQLSYGGQIYYVIYEYYDADHDKVIVNSFGRLKDVLDFYTFFETYTGIKFESKDLSSNTDILDKIIEIQEKTDGKTIYKEFVNDLVDTYSEATIALSVIAGAAFVIPGALMIAAGAAIGAAYTYGMELILRKWFLD